jgi:hypothetical protein
MANQDFMNNIFGTHSAIGSKGHAGNLVIAIVMWMMVFPALAQSAKPAYQAGTVLSVKTHQEKAAADPSLKRYDMSIKVRDTIYVVLYTPPPGSYGGQYTSGMDLLVLVGDKTITYNDMLGRSREVPILSRTKAAEPQTSQ